MTAQSFLWSTLKQLLKPALLLAAVLLATSPLLAQSSIPIIDSATIRYSFPTASTNQITISGEFFKPKDKAPTATLDGATLTVTSSSDTTIVARFSRSLAPGSYLLAVTNHPYSNVQTFTVTNGAVGPQGLPGTNGSNGTNGTSGTSGTNGINGSNGTNGTNGTNGANGTNGTNATVTTAAICGALYPNTPAATCAAALVSAKIVFLTAGLFTGNLGGTLGGNAICQTAAENAGLPGTYKAWLSTTAAGDNPAQKFTQSKLPYVLADGTTQVATNWSGFVSGEIEHTLNETPDGGMLAPEGSTGYWTGTSGDGTPTQANCNNWTIGTSIGDYGGSVGNSFIDLGLDWSGWFSFLQCSQEKRLLCVQQ